MCCTTAWMSRSRRWSGLALVEAGRPARVVAAVDDTDGEVADAAEHRSSLEHFALLERPAALHTLEVGTSDVVQERSGDPQVEVKGADGGLEHAILRESGHEAAERPLRTPDRHEVVDGAAAMPTATAASSRPRRPSGWTPSSGWRMTGGG